MNRISVRLEQLKKESRKALVTYVVCGDPAPQHTLQVMKSLVKAGADIIELGVPFSDPMAEGPVIQKAHERALEHNVSLTQTMEIVAEFRKSDSDTPVVLMGYANPVERMGYTRFAELALHSGVDGLLTVDLPAEEGSELDKCLAERGLENIFLIAPTTSTKRIKSICDAARGFVYYVSVKGVTGSSSLDANSVEERVAAIREVSHTPVLVGFGIKDAPSAKQIGQVSDGVVVGSALVNIMADNAAQPEKMLQELEVLVGSMRLALDELAEGK